MKYVVIMYLSLFTHYIKYWMLGTLNRDGVEKLWIYGIYGNGYTVMVPDIWTQLDPMRPKWN